MSKIAIYESSTPCAMDDGSLVVIIARPDEASNRVYDNRIVYLSLQKPLVLIERSLFNTLQSLKPHIIGHSRFMEALLDHTS